MYTVTFRVGSQNFKLDNMSVKSEFNNFDEAFVTSRMEDQKRKHPAANLNIAWQVLNIYPDAYNIIVVNNGQAVLALIVFIFLLLFGAIVQTFVMCGIPKKGNLFRNVLEIPQYKKFRKIYLIIGGIVYACLLAFAIVCFILLKDLSTMALYILAGYNVVYFIVAVIIGNNIYKKYHVDEPLPDVNNSDETGEEYSEEYTSGEELSIDEELKIAEALKSYKALLDEGIITQEEFDTKKKALLERKGKKGGNHQPNPNQTNQRTPFGQTNFKQEKKERKPSKGAITALWIFSIMTVLGLLVNTIVSLAVWGALYPMFKYILYGYIGGFAVSGIGLILSIIFLVIVLQDNKKEKSKKRTVVSIVAIVSMVISTAYIGIVLLTGNASPYKTRNEVSASGVNGVCITQYKVDNIDDNISNLSIPSEINGKKVVAIDSDAFEDPYGYIRTLRVPSTVERIGLGAFSKLEDLNNITLPFVGESRTSNQFLAYIFGDSVVEDYVSWGGSVPNWLETVTVLDGCEVIGERAFYMCHQIDYIYLPSSIRKIGNDAFCGCNI